MLRITLTQKIQLLRGLLQGDFAYTGPFIANIKVTSICNLNCLCCDWHSPIPGKNSVDVETQRTMSLEMFQEICDQLRAVNTSIMIITGKGEPLLHRDIFDFIATAKQRGFTVLMFTNGTLLDQQRIRALVDCGLDVLKVSLWASSSLVYEKNYPGTDPANFTKIIDGLKQLARFKKDMKKLFPVVDLCHPINHNNFDSIEDMVEVAQITGVDKLRFEFLMTGRQKDFKTLSLAVDEKQLVCASLQRIRDRLNKLKIQHNIGQILLRYRVNKKVRQQLPCYNGWSRVVINVEGTVYPCGYYSASMGNINQANFAEIWNNSSFRAYRKGAMRRTGSFFMSERCGLCNKLVDNYRIHRIYKWFIPFSRLIQRK